MTSSAEHPDGSRDRSFIAMRDVREAVSELAQGLRGWLASGACQSDSGAFYAWIDPSDGTSAYEYPEITGYALTWFAGQPERMPEEEAAGRRAAEWLLRRFRSGDWSARSGWDNGAAYSFDLAIISAGLVNFGRVSGHDQSFDQGLAIAAGLADQTRLAGRLTPISRRSLSESSREPGWSNPGSAHLAKAAQCLLLAAEEGVGGADEAAVSVIQEARRLQGDDGRFITHLANGRTMLHPHLYAVEGLWIFGSARGDLEAISCARAGLEWAWGQQQVTGALPRFAPGTAAPAQADVTAQAVRMAVALDLTPPGFDAAVSWLCDTARGHDRGLALPYQPASGDNHLNTWATLFGAQATQAALPDRPGPKWQTLV